MHVGIVGIDIVDIDIGDHPLAGEVVANELLGQEQFGLIIDLGWQGEDEGTGELGVYSSFGGFD